MIYFILAGELNRVKIGYSDKDVRGRLEKLQTSSPARLELLGTSPGSATEEDQIHKKFESKHIGGEWYSYDEELREFVKNTITDVSQPVFDTGTIRGNCVGCNVLTKHRYNLFSIGESYHITMCRQCYKRTLVEVRKEKKRRMMANARIKRWVTSKP